MARSTLRWTAAILLRLLSLLSGLAILGLAWLHYLHSPQPLSWKQLAVLAMLGSANLAVVCLPSRSVCEECGLRQPAEADRNSSDPYRRLGYWKAVALKDRTR
jgi:hypothetical protein